MKKTTNYQKRFSGTKDIKKEKGRRDRPVI